MKKLLLFFIVFFAASCEKSEYVNPYYTKEQLSVIETLCNTEWIHSDNAHCVSRFYTMNNQPFNIFYTENNEEIIVDGVYVYQFANYMYDWKYFRLNIDDKNDVTINFYFIEQSRIDPGTSVAYKVDWIIKNLPPTAVNVGTMPVPLQIWEAEGVKYIRINQTTYYCK